MSDTLNAELCRLRNEVSRLKSINQRLEFEKVQQNQKLEAVENASTGHELVKDECHVSPVGEDVKGGVAERLPEGGCPMFSDDRVDSMSELLTSSESVAISISTPRTLSPAQRQAQIVEDEPLAPTDFMRIDKEHFVHAKTPDVPEVGDSVATHEVQYLSSVRQETSDHSVSKAEFLRELAFRQIVKVNHTAMTLSEDLLYELLGHLSPSYPIDTMSTLISRHITKETISRKFGGNVGGLIQRPADSAIRVHGYTHFLCPKLEVHPHAPQTPGTHGLILRCGLEDGIVDNEEERKVLGAPPHKVIVGLAPDQWVYMGNYELERGEPLGSDQWLSFSWKVRDSWARMILAGKNAIQAETRASIALRKEFNREPSGDEIKDLVKWKGEVWQNVKKADIMAAYVGGEEKVVPWVMIYVGYDREFQERLLDDETYRRGPKRASTGNGTGSSSKKMKFDLDSLW